MDEKIIATFCLCDDLLKAIEHPESAFPQQLNDAEVMTIALVAASCFQGRHDPARFMLAQHGYWLVRDKRFRRGLTRSEHDGSLLKTGKPRLTTTGVLHHANRRRLHRQCRRPAAPRSHRRRPKRHTKTRLARTHHSRKRTRTRHRGNHAPNRQVKGLCLALAKALYARRRWS